MFVRIVKIEDDGITICQARRRIVNAVNKEKGRGSEGEIPKGLRGESVVKRRSKEKENFREV